MTNIKHRVWYFFGRQVILNDLGTSEYRELDMNYDKLTKNSGITKSAKKSMERRLEAEGLKIQSGEKMIRITDDVTVVPIKLTKKQRKKYQKFIRTLQRDEEKEKQILTGFLYWFMDAHEITYTCSCGSCLPDPMHEDEYVLEAWHRYLWFVCFSNNPMFRESLEIYESPEFRKKVTPLKYQSADLLEVA